MFRWIGWKRNLENQRVKKFKELVKDLNEKKFKLPRGEQEVDSYFEKGQRGKKVAVIIAKKSNKFKVGYR